MSASPCPAAAVLPPPRAKRLPKVQPAKRDSLDGELTIEALLVRVSVKRGVLGVPTSAVQRYVQMLLAGASTQRSTIVPAVSIEAALAEAADEWEVPRDADGNVDWSRVPSDWIVDSDAPGVPHPPDYYPGIDAHDPSTCTDPCCSPDDGDELDRYCADEGHVVLSDTRGYYGVGGAW